MSLPPPAPGPDRAKALLSESPRWTLSRWGMTPKLLAAFLLVAVLPVVAASLFTLNYFYDVSFQRAQLTLGKELGTARHFLDEAVRKLEAETRLAARENVVALNLSLGLTAPAMEYLTGLGQERQLSLVSLLDLQGRPLDPATGVPSKGEPAPYISTAQLELARERNGVSFFVVLPSGRLLALALVPISDGGSSVSHYLAMGLDPGSGRPGGLLDTIRQVVSGPVVFGANGHLLGLAPDSPSWSPDLSWPAGLPQSAQRLTARAGTEDYLFGFVGIEGTTPAWIGLSFSLDEYRRVTNAAALFLVVIALLCLTLSSVAAVAFSRALTRPLLTMARQAQAWTEGQGGQRLEVTTHDESGVLGRAFNEVLDRLDVTLYSLRKTQNYMKNIFNSLTSILISIDETGTVQEWNVAAERFGGIPAAQAVGIKIGELSPVFTGLDAALERAVASREPQFLKRDLGRGHERRSFDLCLYPLVWNGVSGVVIRMDDITESLRKDRQLQQAQKMETIGTLTEGIAHNFNNLMTGITGTVSLVRLEIEDPTLDREQLRSRMAMIDEATRRASEIVHRLMALTHGSPGEFGPLDLAAVVREVAKTSKMVLDRTVEVDTTELPAVALVHGDRSQLEQALLNLIINASHAMTFMRPKGSHHGGTVRITLKSISEVNDFLASHPEALRSDYWLLQVQDSGVGIRPEDLGKIFDPFFTTKDMDKGSGLGLAMVYSSLRHHNGFVDVYSELGRGTTFSLYLPVPPEGLSLPVPRAPREIETRYRGHGLILVVDDEVVVQNTAQMILRACGYEVILANNGLDALEQYRRHGTAIRAILLDSSMPQLSGAETHEALKGLNPAVKVVMTSGLFEGTASSDESGGDNLRFLPKPFSLAQLSRAFHDLLEGTAARSTGPKA